jgi:Integrase core domain
MPKVWEMDMHSRDQYLETLREEYRRASKKEKSRLLSEARKRTRLNRKVLIRKLTHPRKAARGRARRGASYGTEVVRELVRLWELFDFACGQRLAAALRTEVPRLRSAGKLRCSEAVAKKLVRISPKTIDRLLRQEKRVRRVNRPRSVRVHPLLYQKIPVKVAGEWDTHQVGNVQVDYVEHCGRSGGGQFIHTVSTVDIASGWWEGEAIPARTQEETRAALDGIRKRAPFRVREIHPDNDSGLINDLLWRYCRQRHIQLSRSRPYKKNDNAWVEQRNWTHVRKVVGYRRFDTTAELTALRALYACLRLYRNFFQPSMKLESKERMGGQIHRKYEAAKTPYQRLLESGQLSPAAEGRLRQQYQSLDVVELRRALERMRNELFDLVEGKQEEGIRPVRRGSPIRVDGRQRRKEWIRRYAARA